MRVGYFLATEEFAPDELIAQAAAAEQAGFGGLWISDHYHPWNDVQGQSPFVWSVIGALGQTTALTVTTAVTCPSVRIHPAIIAQAAATSAVMLPGGFRLGLGTGEALNEHILGDAWPPAKVRREMLAEAISVIRELWTGDIVHHHGRYFTVEDARIYTLPSHPPEVFLSGFGKQAVSLAGEIADGLITMGPASQTLRTFRETGGTHKPAHTGFKVCWAPGHDEAVEIAWRRWPNLALPGELGQVLSSPRHFESATSMVSRDMVANEIVCGPKVEDHVDNLRQYAEAGFDEVYVANIGPYQEEFFDLYRDEVLPALADHSGR